MCKEDVRIKRKTESNEKINLATYVVGQVVFKADPDRVSLGLSLREIAAPGAGEIMGIGYKSGNGYVPLLVVSAESPTDRVRIEDIGIPLTYEIVATDVGNNNLNASAYSVRFTEQLADV